MSCSNEIPSIDQPELREGTLEISKTIPRLEGFCFIDIDIDIDIDQ